MTIPASICVSLEWAKMLRDCGYPQGFSGVFIPTSVETIEIFPNKTIDGTYFYWMDVRSNYRIGEPCPQIESIYCTYPMIAAAPTAEEILMRLPIEIGKYALQIYRGSRVSRGWVIYYESMTAGTDEWIYEQYDKFSLANAAASMYCHLAEHNLLPNSL